MFRSITGRAGAFLRLALVAGLVPLVVFTTPSNAAASTVRYGDPASATVQLRGGKIDTPAGYAHTCEITGYWQLIGTVAMIKGAVGCSSGYMISSLKLSNITASGPGCTFSTSMGAELDGTGTQTYVMGPMPEGCQVTDVCLTSTYSSHTWFGSESTGPVCGSWDVGGPESLAEPEQACPAGTTIKGPKLTRAPYVANYSAADGIWRADYGVSITSTDSRKWIGYVIMTGRVTSVKEDFAVTGTPYAAFSVASNRAAGVAGDFPITGVPLSDTWMNRYSPQPPKEIHHEVVGGGVYLADNPYLKPSTDQVPQTGPNGLLGVTDPARCGRRKKRGREEE